MATQRPAFAKRDREMKLKDKARAKAERREARRTTPRTGKGPPIAVDEPAGDAASDAGPTTTTEGAAVAAPAGSAMAASRASGQPD
jgi:hypothetical protein